MARGGHALCPDLAKDSENFPKKVLALFDKHFGFRRSIFFPLSIPGLSGGAARQGNTLSNYITYGIRYGPMYDYKDHIYKDDIFRYSSLPAHLKGKRVIFTEDVMTLEEYERTPLRHPHGRRGPILPGGALLLPGGAGDRLHGPLPHPGGGGFQEEERPPWNTWRSWWRPTTKTTSATAARPGSRTASTCSSRM